MKSEVHRDDLVYPDLSYRISGILFEVFKELGPGYQEKYYERAIAVAFAKENLRFEEQLRIPLQYHNRPIGSYVLDFLTENVIVLEIKKGNYFKKQNIDQVFSYLKAKNLRLGLIANFTANGVKVKRIVNIN